MRTVALIICLVLWSASPSSAQTIQDALSAGEKGDHKAAVEIFNKLTEAGNKLAQFFLGYRYLEGRGVPQSVETADQYLEPLRKTQLAFLKERNAKAAEMAVYIGSCYIQCVQKRFITDKQATAWFLLADELASNAEKGRLQKEISEVYEEAARRHPILIKQAIKWYRKAKVSGGADIFALKFRLCEKLYAEGSSERYSCAFQADLLIEVP